MNLLSRFTLLLAVLFLALAAAGCQPAQAFPAGTPPSPAPDCDACGLNPPAPAAAPVWHGKISGCSAEADPQQDRSPSIGTEKGPELALNGAVLLYTHAANHNCCMKVTAAADVQSAQITITEDWQGKVCRCVCFSEITAELAGLSPGAYTLQVIQKGDPDALELEKEATLLTAQIDVK